MKFKKVEISAFRIYDDPKNATFDLTAKSGNAAGFVSLYAPNGFGKTSFYDAVEFAITKSINRFYLRSKELEKLADFQSMHNELPFIRNSNSKSTLNTYVKVYTDQNEEPIYAPFKKHGNQTHDLNFKKPVVDEFQKVILAQEWISAFLTESDGETRYVKFMENPELSGINNYYNNVKNIWTAYLDKVRDLQNKISELKSNIEAIDTGNLLETVNGQITLLNEKYGETSLTLITLSATQEEIMKFKDAISNKVISSNREDILIQLLNYVSIAKSGDDHTIGIDSFYSNTKLLNNNKEKLSTNRSLLEKFELVEKSGAQLDSEKLAQQKYVEEKELVNRAFSFFDEYERAKNAILEKNDAKTKSENISIGLNNRLEELNRLEISYRNQIDTAVRRIEDLSNKKSKLPATKNEIDHLNVEIKNIEKQINDTKTEIELKEKESRDIEDKIEQIKKTIQNIGQDQYPQLSPNEYQELSNLISDLEDKKKNISSETERLKTLDSTINQQKNLNEALDEFIKMGLSIVNERQTSSCPLCEQVYNSYADLVDKITNNKALNDSLKKLLSEKSTVSLLISGLIDEVKLGRNTLIAFYNTQIEDFTGRKREVAQLLDILKKKLENGNIDLNNLRQRNDGYIVELGGLPPDEFEKQLDKETQEATKTRDDINLLLSANRTGIDTATEQLKTRTGEIDLLKGEVTVLESSEKHLFVISWFKGNYPDQIINRNFLIEKDTSLATSIENLANTIKVIEKNISALNKELASFKKEILLIDKTELEKLIIDIEGKINSYKYFLKDKLEVDLSQLDEKQLIKAIEDKEVQYKSDLSKAKSLLVEYQKLEKYSENILPFLQSENAKLELKKNEEELVFLTEKVKPVIEIEQEKTKKYLDNRVKKFFYENLINDLYKKIDPHPDFKSVEFKANFDTENPRLDVFVRNKNNEDALIPNLYFSTAQ